MKRIRLFTVLLLCLLALSACGKVDPAPAVTEPVQTEVTEPAATEPEVTEPEVTEPEVTEPAVTEPEVTEPEVTEPEPEPEPEGNVNPLTGLRDGISDEAMTRRPVAIMVSNSYNSLPQWGISQADIIYEMLAEGRITRFMAIFKDPSKITKLASIRSARPYFIDIAQSYGAVYMHFGGSEPAYEAIGARSDLINLDGIRGGWEGSLYRRDPDRRKSIGLEHSVYTQGDYVETALASLKRDLSQETQPSAFTFGEEHSALEGDKAEKVTLTFSERHQPYFVYNEKAGTYKRWQYGDPHMDAWLNKQIEVKNLLVLRMAVHDRNDELKLIDVTTTGSGKGFYCCEGKVVPITWKKDGYNKPISFYTADGAELIVSPGQTFVSCVTETASVDIK